MCTGSTRAGPATARSPAASRDPTEVEGSSGVSGSNGVDRGEFVGGEVVRGVGTRRDRADLRSPSSYILLCSYFVLAYFPS